MEVVAFGLIIADVFIQIKHEITMEGVITWRL